MSDWLHKPVVIYLESDSDMDGQIACACLLKAFIWHSTTFPMYMDVDTLADYIINDRGPRRVFSDSPLVGLTGYGFYSRKRHEFVSPLFEDVIYSRSGRPTIIAGVPKTDATQLLSSRMTRNLGKDGIRWVKVTRLEKV